MPRSPAVSRHAAGLSDRVFGALVAKAKARGGTVFPLHVGDTYLEPFALARAEAQRADANPGLHQYAPVQGEPALIDAIIAKLERLSGGPVSRESVQVVSGATSGLNIVCTALLEPGDEVLLPAPFWPLIRGIVRSGGAVPVEVPFFDRLRQPAFDARAALEAAITPRTAAIYVNTPHNPTGRSLSENELRAIEEIAVRHDLWVISDEVYDELWYGAQPPPRVWTRPRLRERTIAAHSLSKSHALAGARVGFVHGPLEPMQTIRGVQTFLTYCAPRPMQLGAAAALRDGGVWLENARTLYREAGSHTARALGLEPPSGGTFLFFDTRPFWRTGESILEFLERCLDAGVLLTPGSASGRDYESWARLCFTAVPPAELRVAIDALARVLDGSQGPRSAV